MVAEHKKISEDASSSLGWVKERGKIASVSEVESFIQYNRQMTEKGTNGKKQERVVQTRNPKDKERRDFLPTWIEIKDKKSMNKKNTKRRPHRTHTTFSSTAMCGVNFVRETTTDKF